MTLKEYRGMNRMNRVYWHAAKAARRELERKRLARIIVKDEETTPVDMAMNVNEDHFRFGEELLDAARIEGDEE